MSDRREKFSCSHRGPEDTCRECAIAQIEKLQSEAAFVQDRIDDIEILTAELERYKAGLTDAISYLEILTRREGAANFAIREEELPRLRDIAAGRQ